MNNLATVDLFQWGTYYATVYIAGDTETMRFAKDWVAENTEAGRRAEVYFDGSDVKVTYEPGGGDNDGLPFEAS